MVLGRMENLPAQNEIRRSMLLTPEKPTRFLLSFLLLIATLEGCSEAESKSKPVSRMLKSLDDASSESERAEAIESLRHRGTNAFPFLVAEMNSFRWHIPEEKDQEVLCRTRRLRTAFEVFGTSLAPLKREFVANLETNRNFVSALDGLVSMGGQGIPYVIGAMTNREPAIRLNAVAAVLKVGRTNPDIGKLAVPNLILLLGDQSALIRSLAALTLGASSAEPDASILALLKLALADPDEVVRSQAVKGVGKIQMRLGRVDSHTKTVLEEISQQDRSLAVRLCAERILAGKEP